MGGIQDGAVVARVLYQNSGYCAAGCSEISQPDRRDGRVWLVLVRTDRIVDERKEYGRLFTGTTRQDTQLSTCIRVTKNGASCYDHNDQRYDQAFPDMVSCIRHSSSQDNSPLP